ncbi:hypothetical protein EDD11_008753 [Mortierella claussenii]|nr:hypothetical protein EDD11_008753 [Mortierella claussenii]
MSTIQSVTFTPQELHDLKEAFSSSDSNQDGLLDTFELGKLVAALNEEVVPEEELKFVIKSFDTDNDGKLNYEEFLQLMTTLRSVGRD